MKVLLASTVIPTVRGGASTIVNTLEQALENRGHEVETLLIPFHSDPSVMLDQMLGLRMSHVEDSGDRLICIRTPSYLLRHPSKVLWFIHHHRPAYDLWGTRYGNIPDTPRGRAYRDIIRQADNRSFEEARRIFTNSKVMSRRLREFNGFDSEVLYPPLAEDHLIRPGDYGDTIVYVSRLAEHKRQELAIRAMRHTRTDVRLVVAGEAEDPSEADRLQRLIASWGLERKVELRSEWISEEDKAELLASALAVVYCPFEEDSYGYAALEAQIARKAVVTTTDSGGVGELIEDGRNGYVLDPTPEALAATFDSLFSNRTLAEHMGREATVRIDEMGISWDTVIEGLLA